MTTPRLHTISILAAALLLGACGGVPDAAGEAAVGAMAERTEDLVVVVHRTEACECCGQYEEELRAAGFTVERELHVDLAEIKRDFSIPDDQRSCHTNEIAGYAAEGHVPVPALLRLVEETPDVAGISLPGMPVGSPGMPGEQEGPFVVYSFDGGEVTGEFARF